MSDAFDSKAFLKTLPQKPGVYVMLDAEQKVLYVGKAKKLKNRVSSYFQKNQPAVKTQRLVEHIADIKVTITETETEALLLELNLIKEHKPRYNVIFRDDKSYPYLYLSIKDDFPRLELVRGKRKKNGRYFGPYPSTGAAREALSQLQKLFKIRQCSNAFFKGRSRPCLQYQIQRCSGPCVGLIEKDAYDKDIENTLLFLQGKSRKVIQLLEQRMQEAASMHEYEKAAIFRDQIARLQSMQNEQSICVDSSANADVMGMVEANGLVCIALFVVRDGQIVGDKKHFISLPKNASRNETWKAFLTQYYLADQVERQIPSVLIISEDFADRELVEQLLTNTAEKKISVLHKVRGVRARWLSMAQNNAQEAMSRRQSKVASSQARLDELAKLLKLADVPKRMECFDVSHTQGESPQASCVVFENGASLRSDYRRYNITGITKGDDYAALRQALTRRYERVKRGEGKLPDLILIDGGKGQLHVGEEVLNELQITDCVLMGISKGEGRKAGLETLHISGGKAFCLSEDSLALHLLQQIRDEAHRFAITGHRGRRDKARKESPLESIPGIGAKRRRELILALGGWQGVKNASVSELSKVPGISLKLAQTLFAALHDT